MRKALVITSICAAIVAIPAGCSESKKGFSAGARISPETHIASGKMLEAQRNYIGAAGQYQQAINGQPNLTIAYHRLAELYLKLGRFDEAGSVLRTAIEAGADEASLRNNLGYTLMKMGRYDEAEQMLAAALAISPTFHRARMNLGLLHARAGRIDESIETFERIVPREDALYNVAVIRMSERDYVTAAWAFGEAVQIQPNFADARQQLEKAMFLAQHSPQRSADAELLSAVAQTPAPTETPIVARATHRAPQQVAERVETDAASQRNARQANSRVAPKPVAPSVAVAKAPEPKPEPAAMRDVSTRAPRPATVASKSSALPPLVGTQTFPISKPIVRAAPTPTAEFDIDSTPCPDESDTPEPTVLASATPRAQPMLPKVESKNESQPRSSKPTVAAVAPTVMTSATTVSSSKAPVQSMTSISMK